MLFNYKYQVWYDDQANYTVECCAHPESMRPMQNDGDYKICCNQYALAGCHIQDVEDGTFDHLCVDPLGFVTEIIVPLDKKGRQNEIT